MYKPSLTMEQAELILILFFQLLHLLHFFNCAQILNCYNLYSLCRIIFAAWPGRLPNVETCFFKYKYAVMVVIVAVQLLMADLFILSEFLQSFLILIIGNLATKKDVEKSQTENKEERVLRVRRRTRDDDERVLELIDQGYFLYRQINMQPFTNQCLVYTNRKGKEMVCELGCESEDIADHLWTSDEPKKTLREYINDSLDDTVQVGNVEKVMLSPGKGDTSENIAFQSVPFKYFKGELWKLTKSDVLLILGERSGKRTLGILEGLKHAIVCTLSHELKTLANGITGNIELVTDDPGLGKEQRIHQGIALCSSYLLGSRLKDLFDYIQLQNKGFKLHYSEFVIEDLLRDVRKIGTSYAGQKQVQFLVKKRGRLPRAIVGDKERIEQILMNLLSKAIEFTDYGKVVLEIRRKREGRILFKVISYGSSMQSKLEQQMKNLSPTSKKLWKELAGECDNKRSPAVIKNLEALSLEISQILCREMGTQIIAKNVEGKLSQLKFGINDGFVSAKQSSAKLWKTFRRSTTHYSAESTDQTKDSDGKIEDIAKSSHLAVEGERNNSGEKGRKGKSLFALEGRAIFRNDSTEQMLASDEIPNEIAPTTPINIPTSKAINLMESLHPQLHSKTIGCSSDFPFPFPVKENPKMLVPAPPKVAAQPSFRTTKLRRVTLSESTERRFKRVGLHSNVDDVDRCSILIVDDDGINRWVLKSLLKKFGYNSIEAKDGKEAVSLIEGYIRTDKLYELLLILMDLQMPVLDGILATKKIRELCENAYVNAPPIIGVTADPIESDRGKFLRAGLREMLSKPVDSRKVEYIINKYIRSVCQDTKLTVRQQHAILIQCGSNSNQIILSKASMKWNYTTFHNLAAAAVSLTAMILTIIYVKELREEFMPEVPRAFERLKTFYLAECIRLSVCLVIKIIKRNRH
eukprot:TRINITY_DN120156_c3_g1_i1.p1 TRINITY_DN120156_c3_g1~~TRINITY_DN120156_c3_g1_i1.p1  ORF type:complete len:921 (-),score=77.34 TRINITY_DN120156_c3_g1_i1:4758-7520(-)